MSLAFAANGIHTIMDLAEVTCMGSKECLTRLECDVNSKEVEPKVAHLNAIQIEDGKQFSSLEGSTDSNGSSSSKGDNESNTIVDCEIHWEDLHLREEIGEGSCAIVYHGIWNGSNVAIKVYHGNQYTEGILQDYQKERLRHPNVLLFMRATYSQERLAIVTAFLPRGSLFRTLHKNNQAHDIRQRLRMALDVELMTESIPWNHLNSLQVVGVVGFMDRRLDLPEGFDPHVASAI
ncbi:hypothetical protein FEM48_Zijuj11G0042000 [Ziziphus jujuba var. spinosa]|uniref:Protein kinase domain-containing protein n=1 Tax=Ziziphus jujuba var. spinosa TaxID=714518 RepID=A0A978UGR6_ZIZJJ|nr:hypothetical protein FEM48_Zijuj11G0042000 [Ziziphus jujuba var. spinosa]